MITLTVNDNILRCTLAGVYEFFQGAYRFLEMKIDIFWYPLQRWTYFGIQHEDRQHFGAQHLHVLYCRLLLSSNYKYACIPNNK